MDAASGYTGYGRHAESRAYIYALMLSGRPGLLPSPTGRDHTSMMPSSSFLCLGHVHVADASHPLALNVRVADVKLDKASLAVPAIDAEQLPR